MTPRIVTRDEWGAQPRKPGGLIRPVEALRGTVVHHEAGVYGPRPVDAVAEVRAIQAMHLAQGYLDIAYNAVVDRWGTVYLGRDAGMRGGHTVAPGTEDWNWTHLGVCILGDGDDPADVTDAAWASVLWCWSLAAWTSGGRATGLLTHRETGSATWCPGAEVQRRMDSFRIFLANLGDHT